MKSIVTYFNAVPDSHRVLLFAGIAFCIWGVESIIPLCRRYNKWKHGLYNLLFLIAVLPVQYLMGMLLNGALRVAESRHAGLLNLTWFHTHLLVTLVVGFLLMDLGEYAYHYGMHKTRRLWLFHAVHHLEENVDVSTTLREHPFETAIRLGLTMLWIVLTGIPIWALLFRQFVQIASNLFSHSNFRLPKRLNAVVGLVFITPNLHHVHHHFEQPYTDMNYGDVLSVWDRLFGTFYNGALDVRYGLDAFQGNARRHNPLYLLILPFRP